MKRLALMAFAVAAFAAPALADGSEGVHALVDHYAAKHGVPGRIAHGVVRVESGYRCNARNRSGAAGLGQLMPRTARALGVRNPLDCRQNLDGAMRYLREALSRGGAGCAGISLYNRGTYARPVCTAYGRKVLGGHS
ncbi:Membrane-bound lytic murein transglycosylase F [Methylobacterium adhaesivum]|uniref:Lytic transglycosylase domain-containing protein n=1 Tax=Methylobacterium adhaesivum TaxID=333297 RepID=A0ABT8BLL2_9HYPH|nr:lytic transglycosylase domain-containing protein [Methylobacterium adhaesivum]MDN3592076.1 lytic transglycosylase domain-containing protein [Methylobacterium adhaesivum]GJD31463.1 Membrane-bound lytic murein transglycosylase F [Methylobacterium adhaesivum]